MSWRLSLFDPAHENHGILGSPDQCLGSPGLYLDGLITCGDSADMALHYKCYRKGSTLLLDHCAMLRQDLAPGKASCDLTAWLRPASPLCARTVGLCARTIRENQRGSPRRKILMVFDDFGPFHGLLR